MITRKIRQYVILVVGRIGFSFEITLFNTRKCSFRSSSQIQLLNKCQSVEHLMNLQNEINCLVICLLSRKETYSNIFAGVIINI